MMAWYLLPIADREPLIWILRERMTAFAAHRGREAGRLARGDRLLLYTTRGCFHNPTRDRGRIIGLATVKGRPRHLDDPVRFGNREFPIKVDLAFEVLVPRDEGLELAPLVRSLPRTFKNPDAWSASMRRALVPVDDAEAEQLGTSLGVGLVTRDVVESYATGSAHRARAPSTKTGFA
jgi:hypothetical protein